MLTSRQQYQLIKEHRAEGNDAIRDIVIARAAHEGAHDRRRERHTGELEYIPSRRKFLELHEAAANREAISRVV